MRVLGLVSCLLGCGGARAAPEASHEDFRRIQLAEAEIERTHADQSRVADCAASCLLVARARQSADDICAIAEETFDLDVRARCAAAQRVCSEMTGACECESL